tara:strand:+ start:2617 stop:3228 length:612 start_codon:yes stop_codon:yes gene_type:complete
MTLTVVTRTKNRPDLFARLVKSLGTYVKGTYTHIVSVERDVDAEYVKTEAPSAKIINVPLSVNCTDEHKPYNLHINTLVSSIEDGWIVIIDDDDYLVANLDFIPREDDWSGGDYSDTMYVWKMSMPWGEEIPDTAELLGGHPIEGRIGTPCVCFHAKYRSYFEWDSRRASDFRAISKLYSAVPNIIPVNKIMVCVGQIGNGKC